MTLHQSVAAFDDLAGFLSFLEERGHLTRVQEPVSLVHEITEIHRRVMTNKGPALLFEKPIDAEGKRSFIPILVNLFGSKERIEWGLGVGSGGLGALGGFLGELKEPEPPSSLRDAWKKLPHLRAALSLKLRQVSRAPCQEVIWTGKELDLAQLPIQTCWPGEPAPLVTWPLVITVAPDDPNDINVGVYRMQKLSRDQLIMRWLAHRGGARHHRMWQALGKDMPVAVVIGADPATILAAVMPLPDRLSELSFAGVLKGRRQRVVSGVTVPLPVPAAAEIVLEGHVSATETADEGPYGDHTGYYNSTEPFPVMTVSAITMRRAPIYLSTFTGRPPDEPSVIGEAMNEVFVPLVSKQFPEIKDLWLPPAACSYRTMIVSIDKRYPGQARRIMMGLWSILPQFSYTKLIIAVDPDINVRDWDDVMWAIATRFDASRDLLQVDHTPIDYLDFASPKSGLGSKIGLDATKKIGAETDREWGAVLAMSPDVIKRIDGLWNRLGLEGSCP